MHRELCHILRRKHCDLNQVQEEFYFAKNVKLIYMDFQTIDKDLLRMLQLIVPHLIH